jgi:hypothetical protein
LAANQLEEKEMKRKWSVVALLLLVVLSAGLTEQVSAVGSGRVDGYANAFLTGSGAQPVGVDVAIVPDMNGDGYDEVAVGASAPNRVYVVLGGPDGWGMRMGLALNNPAIITYTGDNTGDLAGFGVAGVGDVNGDGFGDLLVGAPFNDVGGSNAGAIYVVFGSASLSSTNLGTFPIMIGEAAGDEAGRYVAPAGDVNADGYQDMLVGIPGQDSAGANAGAVYLILGSGTIGNASLGSKIKYTGEAAGDMAGGGMDGLGDMNGDGYMDFVAGAPSNDDGISQGGAAYVILGSSIPAGGSLGGQVQYTGWVNFQSTGQEVSAAGDFNGDGFADLMVGGTGATPGVALVLGSATPVNASLSGSVFYAGSHGANVVGSHKSMGYGGDINGDGYGDVLIGSESDSGNSGAVYLAYGTANPANASLTTLPKLAGVAAGDSLGSVVRGNGDVNGDGLADIVIGTMGNDEGGANAGGAYLIFGGKLPSSFQERQRLNPAGNTAAIQLNTADVRVDFVSGALAGGDVTVERHFYHPCATDKRLQAPIWTLDSSKLDGAASANLRFSYTNAQIAGMDESSLRLWTRPAGEPCSEWTVLASTVNVNNNTITINGLTNLGQFAISEAVPSPTAVREPSMGLVLAEEPVWLVAFLAALVLSAGATYWYLRGQGLVRETAVPLTVMAELEEIKRLLAQKEGNSGELALARPRAGTQGNSRGQVR